MKYVHGLVEQTDKLKTQLIVDRDVWGCVASVFVYIIR